MMAWKVIGALVLVTAALVVAMWAFYRLGRADGRKQLLEQMAENRALRRAEGRRPHIYTGHHRQAEARLQPFPDREPFEQLATTGELRAYAETGDIGSLKRETAAFFRILALRSWTRAA